MVRHSVRTAWLSPFTNFSWAGLLTLSFGSACSFSRQVGLLVRLVMIESSGSRAGISTGYSDHLPGANSGLASAAGKRAINGLLWVSAVIQRKEVMRHDDQQERASVPCAFH